MNRIQVVVGGQYGSEGKGAVCRWLASGRSTSCVRVGGPNAGHTAYDPTGKEWKLQQVPIGAIANSRPLYIGAGSEIDTDLLESEIRALDEAGFEVSKRLMIDPMATVVLRSHSIEEYGHAARHGTSGLTRTIGSTGKGVGAARADRIWRRAAIIRNLPDVQNDHMVYTNSRVFKVKCQDTAWWMRNDGSDTLQIEATQGFGLGLHQPTYPFATSVDCRAIDALSQAGISPWEVLPDRFEAWVVLRTFPIRVAGNSGPMYREISWEEIGQEPEHTTVTKKQRRIGEWDAKLARAALQANGSDNPWCPGPRCPVKVVITFLDYVFPPLKNCTDAEHILSLAGDWLRYREEELGVSIRAVGTGPKTLVDLQGEY